MPTLRIYEASDLNEFWMVGLWTPWQQNTQGTKPQCTYVHSQRAIHMIKYPHPKRAGPYQFPLWQGAGHSVPSESPYHPPPLRKDKACRGLPHHNESTYTHTHTPQTMLTVIHNRGVPGGGPLTIISQLLVPLQYFTLKYQPLLVQRYTLERFRSGCHPFVPSSCLHVE